MSLNTYLNISNENLAISEEGWLEDLQVNNFDKWWAFLIKGDPTHLRGKLITTALDLTVHRLSTFSDLLKMHTQQKMIYGYELKFMRETLNRLPVIEKYKTNLDKIISSGKESNFIMSYSVATKRGQIVQENNKNDGYNKAINSFRVVDGIAKNKVFGAKERERDFTEEEKQIVQEYIAKVGPYVKHFSDLCNRWCEWMV